MKILGKNKEDEEIEEERDDEKLKDNSDKKKRYGEAEEETEPFNKNTSPSNWDE